LDDAMLHYLRTRGIPEDEALVLLSYGFINALVETQALDALRGYLKPLLADYFGTTAEAEAAAEQGADLTRHIGA
jgi:Fe-S cluster assembly protein SufD